MNGARQDLLRIVAAALDAVRGDRVVAAHLETAPLLGEWRAVAIGKAAAAMWQGAREVLGSRLGDSLVITKHGHAGQVVTVPGLELVESDHPLPGAASLGAGQRLLDFLDAAPCDARFLFLISGGASSLVEVLPAGQSGGLLADLNRWLLGSGLDIGAMNAVRKRVSRIKGGGLLHWLGGREAVCLLISDVPDDDPAVIGSGLLTAQTADALPDGLPDWVLSAMATPDGAPAAAAASVRLAVVANRELALDAAARAASDLEYPVHVHSAFLDGDATAAGAELADRLASGPAGIHLWAGETTVRLPADPGRGGRNQQLALSAACRIAERDGLYLLSVGTDGTDGPTEDAGALVDGGTLSRLHAEGVDAVTALRNADAGTALEAAGDLIQTGPTGTNVMDLVIGLKADNA